MYRFGQMHEIVLYSWTRVLSNIMEPKDTAAFTSERVSLDQLNVKTYLYAYMYTRYYMYMYML